MTHEFVLTDAAQPHSSTSAPALILLDRDGVINVDSPDYITSPEQWQPIPGALEAIAQLQQHHSVAVCTNQSAVGRGKLDAPTLAAIHDTMNAALAQVGGSRLDVFYCPHVPAAACECRKPQPGLLLTAMRAYDGTPDTTLFVGDSKRDIEAAAAAGCASALVLTGNGASTRTDNTCAPDFVFQDLAAVAASLSSLR